MVWSSLRGTIGRVSEIPFLIGINTTNTRVKRDFMMLSWCPKRGKSLCDFGMTDLPHEPAGQYGMREPPAASCYVALCQGKVKLQRKKSSFRPTRMNVARA